jgi:drug/metabolite transporter (DMT)-like permease
MQVAALPGACSSSALNSMADILRSLLIDGPAAVGQGFAHIGWHGALSTLYTAGLCSLVGYAIFNRLLSRYTSGQVVLWVLLVAGVLVAQGVLRFRRPGRRTRAMEPAPEGPRHGGVPEPAAARP